MLMGDNNLFRWQRVTEPRSYSRQNKIATEDDIEKWLSKIDTAANAAVVRATRDKTRNHSRKRDEVYGEARQLVNSWMKKKDESYSYGDTLSGPGPDRLQIKREWDRLLGDAGYEHDDEETEEEVNRTERGSDFSLTSLLANGGEGLTRVTSSEHEESVEQVMRRMMSKNYVDKRKLRRYEEPPPVGSDMKSKLELRQERAKINREKRQKETEAKRKELALKKEAEAEARKAIIEEERRKAMKARQEEEMIQQEMVKIRKEIQEKRKREEEEWRRIESSRLPQPQTVTDCDEDNGDQETRLLELERRQEQIRIAVLRGQQRQVTHNLRVELFEKKVLDKILQRCFAAWFSLVLDRRLQLGRAAAISDWRQLRLTFHAWRDLTRRRRIDAEAAEAAELAVREQRNSRLADDFARFSLLRRCLLEWRTWILSERVRKQDEMIEEAKRRKMAAFLEAAASTAAKKEDEEEEVEEIFEEPESVEKSPIPIQRIPKTRSNSAGKQRIEPPREPWQVNRDHARKLPIEAFTSPGDAASPPVETKQEDPKVWAQPVKLMNMFENRHKSQQKMLKEQARRLDEQAKMIEELQSQNRITAIQENVNTIRAQREQKKRSLSAKGNREGDVEDSDNSSCKTTERTESTLPSEQTENIKKVTPKRDPIINRMEERAAERARIKAEREQRRKEAEKKKAELAAAHAEELQRQEEEDRQTKARELRERRRLEKQKETEKLARAAELRTLNSRADEFRNRSQLKWRGLKPWLRLMTLRVEQGKMAEEHHGFTIVSRCFDAWKEFVEDRKAQEDHIIALFRKRILLRRYFQRWTLLRHYSDVMELKADEFRNCKLMQITLRQWARVTNDEKIRLWDLETIAKNHYNKVLLRCTFAAFRQLPAEMRAERERERRKEELRRRVMSIVPDFKPPTLNSSTSDL